MATAQTSSGLKAPFDTKHLDVLMENAGMDLMLATSKHNIQYLLGGHRAFFFDYMDAVGITRYLPVFIYQRGAPEKAAFVGHYMENFQHQNKPFWTPVTIAKATGSVDAMQKAVEYIKKAGLTTKRIGVETAFIPMDAEMTLRQQLPDSTLIDALFPLERLRARKTPDELRLLKLASEAVIDSMLAVIANHGPGTTKAQLNEALRREEVNRGLHFEYLLVTCGQSLNRAPSEQRWEEGDILNLDSGGNYHGYIGDVARMAILGEPDSELEDMLGDIEEIQRTAMKPIKAGAIGGEIYTVAEERMKRSKYHNHMSFLAHGMGLISHEAPRLTSTGPVRYDGYDADKPLESGMVVSVETTLQHPKRGFIKLEDTVAVTDSGFEIYGEGGRGWNRGGTALR